MIKRAAAGLLILALLLSGCGTVDEKGHHAYFDANALPGLEALAADTREKNILLIGEHHGIADNYDLYLRLLRGFPEARIQLVFEMPPSFAFLCNEYLRTGDSQPLIRGIENLAGTFSSAREHLAFWQEVRRIAGEEGKSVAVIGVDQEFQLENTALALSRIDEGRFTPLLARIGQGGEKGEEAAAVAALVEAAGGRSIENEEDQAVFDIMESLRQRLDNPRGDKARDLPLYETFARRVDPAVRALGVFGSMHIQKAADPAVMASLLLEDPRFKEQVRVARLFYVDAEYCNPATGSPLALSELPESAVIVKNARRRGGKLAIYRLPDDPLFAGRQPEGHPSPALYDYALLLFDAGAATPFTETQ